MKIDSGTIGMESARSYRARGTATRKEKIKDYRQQSLGGMFGNTLTGTMTNGSWSFGRGEKSELSARQGDRESKMELVSTQGMRRNYVIRINGAGTEREDKGIQEDLRQITIRYIFQLLFAARRENRNHWLERHGMMQDAEGNFSLEETGSSNEVQGNIGYLNAAPWETRRVLETQRQVSYAEEEYTDFAAMGKVRTSDGREIDFQIGLSMSRSFESYYQDELESVKKTLRDPLVINFDAPAAQVRDQKFLFDLDADGRAEEVSRLGSGSGFLALDLNEDGKINDGSELFGTKSGNGFEDLAKYDLDGNGWIDENDEIWTKLKIWAKDETGKDILYRLADKGVGAIYLGSVNTDFSLVGQFGGTEAKIRRTGLFLYENGLAGTVQHLDMAT